MALYGDALVAGSRSPNKDPMMRVVGYMSRSIVSREEGNNGERRVAIFVDKLGGNLVGFGAGEDAESRCCIRCERRGVERVASIVMYEVVQTM